MITRLAELPAGSDLVVRALPGSAGASSAALADDLDQAVRAALALRTNGAAAEAASYAAAEAS
jgi:RNase P protein component